MLIYCVKYYKIAQGAGIFEGLKITEYTEFCDAWMNQYPVLSILFKDMEALTFDGAYKMLKTTVADVCKELDDLMEEDSVNDADAEIFQQLMYTFADEDKVKKVRRRGIRVRTDPLLWSRILSEAGKDEETIIIKSILGNVLYPGGMR